MARSETVRRVKNFSAATGYVFQYYFYEVQKTRRGSQSGTEYVYMVSADRKNVFPLRIFVERAAVEKWEKQSGRALSGTEEYAIAKMRLFEALDQAEGMNNRLPEIHIDETNLDSLLSQLDL